MDGCFGLILILLADFLLTAFLWWIICLVLSACGMMWLWSWGTALAAWVICKILKMIF